MNLEVESSGDLVPRVLGLGRGQAKASPQRGLRIPRQGFTLALILIDVLLIGLAGAITGWKDPWIVLGLTWFIVPVQALFGSYRATGLMPHEEYQRLALGLTAAFVPPLIAAVVLMQALPLSLMAWWMLSIALLLLGRWGVRKLTVHSDYWRIPAIVISDDRFGPPTVALLSRSARSNFRPTALYSLGPSDGGGRNLVTPIPIDPVPLQSRSAMILSLPAIEPGLLKELAAHYSSRFLNVLSIPAVTGNSEVWFERVDGSRSPVDRFRVSLWPQIAKRTFDLVVCLALLLPMLPVFVLVAAAIRLDSKGSIFYTQRRIGRSGKSFEMLKFRTMQPDAEARLAAHLDSDVAFRREWDLYQKLAEDPRVTRVGGVLRKLSLDELPQMLNVIRGDMSLIGPRPMFAGQEPHYGRDFELYTQVRPGLTGLWQISGRNRITFQDRAWLDGFYVRHLSFWLDTYILLKTPLAVLRGEGRADDPQVR